MIKLIKEICGMSLCVIVHLFYRETCSSCGCFCLLFQLTFKPKELKVNYFQVCSTTQNHQKLRPCITEFCCFQDVASSAKRGQWSSYSSLTAQKVSGRRTLKSSKTLSPGWWSGPQSGATPPESAWSSTVWTSTWSSTWLAM